MRWLYLGNSSVAMAKKLVFIHAFSFLRNHYIGTKYFPLDSTNNYSSTIMAKVLIEGKEELVVVMDEDEVLERANS